jgi:hypothetical protein
LAYVCLFNNFTNKFFVKKQLKSIHNFTHVTLYLRDWKCLWNCLTSVIIHTFCKEALNNIIIIISITITICGHLHMKGTVRVQLYHTFSGFTYL